MSYTLKVDVNPKSLEMDTDAIGVLGQRVAKVGFGEYRICKVNVYVTKMISELSNTLVTYCQARNPHLSLTDSDVERYLCTLVSYRCQQITRNLPKGISAAEVPVPDFFRPFLAYIGRYEATFQALEIVPEWGETSDNVEEAMNTDGRTVIRPFEDVTDVLRVYRLLKVSGVRCTLGLPRELVTTDDSIFRICESPAGDLLVAGSDVGEAVLLVRSVIRISFLAEIFGAPRTRYLGVEECRSALDIVLSTGFVQ